MRVAIEMFVTYNEDCSQEDIRVELRLYMRTVFGWVYLVAFFWV